jgi:aspartyl-tRNA(Asn)/glutamyl-tRNA(Gln) amidotransferase subunit A
MPPTKTGEPLHYLTIRELGARYARRELSPVEVTRAILARVRELDGPINAFITVTEEEALRDAERAEKVFARGASLGPLHGVPISLKDLYWTRGVRTTGGSKILADWVPDEDGAVTAKLKRAGAVLIGKTNLHEFAFGATNENPHHGPTRNPWSRDRIPGGSSGGSAAAVAAGMGYASMGSDTGGSIRLPAALCGVVGLKPTYGAVSRYGVLPLSWSLDHAGPLARTVEDVAIVMNAVAGHDARDPASARRVVHDFVAALDGKVAGLRIGLLREYLGEGVQPEIARAVRKAADDLADLGAVVSEVSAPEVEQAAGASIGILYPEAAAVHERWLAERPADYGADVLGRLTQGAKLTGVQYLKAQRARRALVERFAGLFRQIDLLAAPTVPILAPTLEESRGDAPRAALLGYTRLFNVLGLPACSLPCGFSSGGLPIGLQLVGRPFEDATVLRAAHAYEQHAGRTARHPAL